MVTCDAALLETVTVNVIVALAPTASGLFNVHINAGKAEQFQPVPLNAVAVRPVGMLSVTTTDPVVTPGPVLRPDAPVFFTVMVYISPVCPWIKGSVCVLLTVRLVPNTENAPSLKVLLPVLPSPPPATEPVLVTLSGVLFAMVTRKLTGKVDAAAIALVVVQVTVVDPEQLHPEDEVLA